MRGELAGLCAGAPLPGLYVSIEVAGREALVPASRVDEIVRAVELSPLPRPPPHVLGTFVHRGRAVVAVDLASWIGIRQELRLHSNLVVFAAAPPFALLVDAVRGLVDAPLALAGDDGATGDGWRQAGLVASLCRSGDAVVPLLGVERFAAAAAEVVP